MLVVKRTEVIPVNISYTVVKRLIDLLVTIFFAPIFAVITIIVGILIKLDSPGPIFFKQDRAGKGGRVFSIYKFRTMYHNTDTSSHRTFMKQYIKGQLDPGKKQPEGGATVYKPPIQHQITRIGRILRKTSIDELPQLWNVFWGQMSLIGPRPNVLWEVEAYDSWHNERLEVKPGITGLAQVKGRSGIPFKELVKYDLEYVKHRSILLDMKIVWWTALAVLKSDGSG